MNAQEFDRHYLIQGAIATVALSHPDDHDCDVCRASHGDKEALARVIADMKKRGDLT